jgi:disulfide bond formation protein DsbB
MKNFRLISLLGFTLAIFLLGVAFFLQTYKGVNPCPLCLLQRAIMTILGIIFFLGIVFKFKKCGQFFLGVLSLLTSATGMLLSGRQVWLQWSPPSSSGDCSASLQYLLNTFSYKEVFLQIWHGGMECSQTGWEFMHLSLAAWSLVGFTILSLLVIVQLIRAAID